MKWLHYKAVKNPADYEDKGEEYMNIKQAKEEIKHTIEAYLLKDEFSQYCIDAPYKTECGGASLH